MFETNLLHIDVTGTYVHIFSFITFRWSRLTTIHVIASRKRSYTSRVITVIFTYIYLSSKITIYPFDHINFSNTNILQILLCILKYIFMNKN